MNRPNYPTDPTDAQWRRLEPLVPKTKPYGRPAKVSRREILNALFYQAANGCTWRSLPHDLPPYRMVFRYFRAWQKDGTLERMHDALRAESGGRGSQTQADGRDPRQSNGEDDGTRRPTRVRRGEKKSAAASGSWRLIRSAWSGP